MTDSDAVDRLLEVFTVDCCNADEQMTAFHTVFTEEVPLPTEVSLVGIPVQVVGFDIRENGIELIARCCREGDQQELSLADVVFPPESVGAWIHAAYRRCLGLQPYPATIPPGWQPSWL